MSDETKIARVYAEALFEAASETGKLEAVRRDLSEFARALEGSAELRTFFFDEDISGEHKAKLLDSLTAGGEPLVRNFLRLLADKDREFIVTDVVRIFLDLLERAAGVVKVELTTALPLPPGMAQEIKASLEASLARPVDLTLTVDDDIIGGVKLRVGDRIADASLRHRLEQLRTRLVKPTAFLEVSVEAAP